MPYDPLDYDPEGFAEAVADFRRRKENELRKLTREKVRDTLAHDLRRIRLGDEKHAALLQELKDGDEFVAKWEARRTELVTAEQETLRKLRHLHIRAAAHEAFLETYFSRRDALARMRENVRRLEREVQYLEQHGTLPPKPVKARKRKKINPDLPIPAETDF